MENKTEILKDLQTIPSIGKTCALYLWDMGIKKKEDLKDQNPLKLYNKLNKTTGVIQDICMLYTFRCAVYYVSEKKHAKEKLNWWYWKGKTYNEK